MQGILYIDKDVVGWKPITKAWLDTRPHMEAHVCHVRQFYIISLTNLCSVSRHRGAHGDLLLWRPPHVDMVCFMVRTVWIFYKRRQG